LAALGFRETNRQSLTDAYSITGIEITSVGATGTWTKSDVVINGVEMYDENISTATIEGKVNTINAFSGDTGVSASAVFDHVFDMSDAWTGTDGTEYDSTDLIYVNGTSVTYGGSLSALVTSLNASGVKDVTGLTASSNGNNLILKGNGITTVQFELADTNGALGSQTNTSTSGALLNDDVYYGRIRLDSLNNTPISISLGDSAAVAEHGFLETGVGAADFEVNDPLLSAGGGTAVSGLSVATSAGAENALGTLDNAINRVNEIRGDLGAIQNRLDYTINNLSSISNATEGARGRIVDADYAKETSALTKQQILAQAATSMLAQANQSKQSVLALLQS
jgi:flagellin